MKVMLLNGSSRSNGCTGAALAEVARALGRENGIPTPQNGKEFTNFIR